MSTTSQRESLFGSALSAYHSGRRRGDSMPEHKHKPKMVMVISIGAKPKKKGDTGVVKKGSKCYYCKKVMNYDSEHPYPMCSDCAQREDPE